VEPGDRADLLAGHGEHEQSRRGSDLPLRAGGVTREGGLPVGAGGYQVHAVVATEGEAGAQHRLDRVDAVVLVRRWRHGQPRVVGEQRDHAVNVGGDVRVGEPPGQRLLGGQLRPRCLAAACLGEVAVQRGACALQGALDRGLAGAEHAGHLVAVEPEHVAQHERGRLAGRHALQGGDEGQFDRLGGLVAGLWARCGVGDAFEQVIGVGLQPCDLAAAGGIRGAERGDRLGRNPAAGTAQRVEALVGRDAVQPGAQGRALLEPGQPAPGREQRLLQQVLGVVQRAEYPVAVHLNFAPVRIGEFAERVLIAVSGTPEQRRIVAVACPLCQGVLHRSSMPFSAPWHGSVPFPAAVVSAQSERHAQRHSSPIEKGHRDDRDHQPRP
jgi:hypothetical protein